MADAKISALPASTTPLAGTEVLPIVQSGATKKVSVANLTVGRDIAAFGYTQTADSNNFAQLRYGTLKCNSAIVASAIGNVAANSILTLNTTVNTGIKLVAGITNSYKGYVQAINTNNSSALDLFLQPYGGNVSIGNGNLVIGTAGKGIDFSADGQAAGMTSELLDDYEEGTFTPILSDSSGNNATAGFSGGVYTKVGRSISFQLYLININKTGLTAGDAVRISLPFTAIALQYGSTSARLANVSFTTLPVGSLNLNTAYLNLFEAASGGVGADVIVSALTASTSDIFISGCYQTN